MEQYERLWQYQQVDMELDQYEKEMRGNSNRKELLKHRDFLLEQQNVLKKIEADVEIMGDRMEALADEIERLNGSVAEASANFEAHRPEDLEEAKKQIAALQKLITTISRYESELAKMRKDSAAPRPRSAWPTRSRATSRSLPRCARIPNPATASSARFVCAPPRPARSSTASR